MEQLVSSYVSIYTQIDFALQCFQHINLSYLVPTYYYTAYHKRKKSFIAFAVSSTTTKVLLTRCAKLNAINDKSFEGENIHDLLHPPIM